MTKIYSLKDRIEMKFNDIMFANTQESIVRSLKTMFIQTKRPYTKDLDLYEIGEFDRDTGIIKPYEAPKQVDWNCYQEGTLETNQSKQITTEQMAQDALKIKEGKM